MYKYYTSQLFIEDCLLLLTGLFSLLLLNSSFQDLNIDSIFFLLLGFPLLTVGKILSGFKNCTNLFSSKKLLCSLYGTPYTVISSLLNFGFICSSDSNLLLKVQPVGSRAKIDVYVVFSLATCSRKPFWFSFPIGSTWSCESSQLRLTCFVINGSSMQSKMFFFSRSTQILQFNALAIAVKKLLKLKEKQNKIQGISDKLLIL